MPEIKYKLEEILEEIKRDEMVLAQKKEGLVTQDVITGVLKRAAQNRKSSAEKVDAKKN